MLTNQNKDWDTIDSDMKETLKQLSDKLTLAAELRDSSVNISVDEDVASVDLEINI